MEEKAVAVIEKETKDITTQAEAITIANQEQYEKADKFLVADKTLQKRIKDAFDPIVDSAYRTYKEAGNKRKEYLEPVLNAEQIVKDKMIAYDDEMEKKRIEEQRKLELKAKAEEDRKRKILEARAKKWDAKGKTAKAEELQEQAEDVRVDAPIVAPKIDRANGSVIQEIWHAEIEDGSQVPREYLQINMTMLNGIARTEKGARKIPGVRFVCKKIMKRRI